MVLRRFFLVMVAAVLTFSVTKPSHAFVPAFAAAAFNSGVGRAAITFVGGEIVVKTVARGFAPTDPFYATTSKAPQSRFVKWLKSSVSKKNLVIAGVLSSLGYLVSDSGQVVRPLPPDPYRQAGYFWSSGYYASPRDRAELEVANNDYVGSYEIIPLNEAQVTIVYYRPNGEDQHSTRMMTRQVCADYSPSLVADVITCQPDFQPDYQEELITDTELFNQFAQRLTQLDPRQQNAAFTDAYGNIETGFAEILDVPAPQPMPDGSPLPAIGTQTWTYADKVARGVAQSTNPALDTYVPPAAMPEAQFLAEEVALGNQAITSANASNTPVGNVGNDVITDTPTPSPEFDPEILPPDLDPAPSADEILAPLKTLFPSLTSFQAPSHTSECPQPYFSFFGERFTLDQHCTLIAQHSLPMSAAMLLVWAVISLRIVLSA